MVIKRKSKKVTKKSSRIKKTKRPLKAVRNWSRPLPLTEVKKLSKKGYKIIVSSSGFTKGSLQYAKRAKLSLYYKTRKIV
ncbi:MAG: hypothetical protein ABIM98_04325 [candidate division WOR-3 bacterium]